jgi:DNA repair protein RadD
MKLFLDQQKLKTKIFEAWGKEPQNVLAVAPTGSGKTIIAADIVKTFGESSIMIAHRQEIIAQISLAFAKYGIKHNVIAPMGVVRHIMDLQYKRCGGSWISPHAKIFIAGVDTLNARRNKIGDSWKRSIKLWIQDEAHHLLKVNKWGRAISQFPNARGLGLTATASRTDGKGLGQKREGLFDTLVQGPTTAELIRLGRLSDYRLFAPPNSINVTGIPIGKSGDFQKNKLAQAAQDSYIVGDVLDHYQRFARHLKTIVFCTDIKTSQETAKSFIRAGFKAAHVDGETPQKIRNLRLKEFEDGKLEVLMNVDLFGEGFDVPAVECVIFGSPTWSYGRYLQQFGRLLRVSKEKQLGIAIDAVGNVLRHGLPDVLKSPWTLYPELRGSKTTPEGPPLRTCINCYRVWMAYSKTCPHCGYKPVSGTRITSIKQVEGDLTEVPRGVLDILRKKIRHIESNPTEIFNQMLAAGAPQAAAYGFRAKHQKRKHNQERLKDVIALWGGQEIELGNDRYIKFFKKFGMDVLTAQTLGASEAEMLRNLILKDLK